MSRALLRNLGRRHFSLASLGMAGLPVINVTVVSDIICPWCWIGKKKLELAIQQCADRFKVIVTLEPFLLKPDIPPEGQDKPPLAPGKERVSDSLKEGGAEVGVEFTGKADRYPYALLTHALLDYASSQGKQLELCDALYKAYFTDGEYLDEEALVKYARTFELDPEKSRQAMTDQKNLDRIAAKARAWRNKDVTGVPCFFMNGVKTFSGSQTVNNFIKMFEIVVQNYPQ